MYPRLGSRDISAIGCQGGKTPYVAAMKQSVIARPRRPSPILVCKKCLERVSGAKKIRRELKSELKRQRNEAPNERSLKSPRLVTTSCFGICPKKAVVLASGKSLQNGEYILVSDCEHVEDALNQLQSPS
jgi:predicted metal-binding protein